MKNEVAETLEKIEPPVQLPNTSNRRRIYGADVDWSDLKFLIEVADAGSLRKAARLRNVAVNTVRAHLARLETIVGSAVVRRTAAGATLTETGTRLYTAAMDLSRTSLREDQTHGDFLRAPDVMTLGCTEGIGTSWLTPRVAGLAEKLSPITVGMQFDYDLQRDRSLLVDVGLSYKRPTNLDLIVAKLATIHFLLFASPGYLATKGTPTSIEELHDHAFVEQGGPGYNETAIDLLLGADRDRSRTTIKTNSSLAQAYAVANGAGIAILPSYSRAISSVFVPLPIAINMRIPLYYYYPAIARDSSVVRKTIEWLQGVFDPEEYVWFADRFVHPDDFPHRQLHAANVIDIFKSAVDRIGFTSTESLRGASEPAVANAQSSPDVGKLSHKEANEKFRTLMGLLAAKKATRRSQKASKEAAGRRPSAPKSK